MGFLAGGLHQLIHILKQLLWLLCEEWNEGCKTN